ncbi:MAG TPA: hypothetical protein VGQ39_20070 [Pyrinomonadaceae bacterium]|jgi:hypothetical protein|nr:hypothetical protein [Pyrinomonadaceae bacterium]
MTLLIHGTNALLRPRPIGSAISVICGSILLAALMASEVDARPCAKTSVQQDAWVRRSIDTLIRSARRAYEEDRAERAYSRQLGWIANTMKQCKLADDLNFISRYPEFVEYIRVLSLDQQKDHELGFEVTDRVYFNETQAFVAIPDFLITPEFLLAVRRFETLGKAKTLLRAMNAKRAANDQLLFFSYESRHLGTPDNDNSYRRLLIVVPGNPAENVPEKWVQFGIPDPRARVPVRNLSVIAVVPGPEKTTNTYFKDYFRTYGRNGSVNVKGRWALGYGDDNCVKCHKSGVLPIFPVDGSVSEDEKPLVEAVNQRFLTYGAPRFGRYLDASKFGPGLGSKPQTPDPRHLTPNCASCHQPNGLGWLNWPMDSVLISSFVEAGKMPLSSNLKEWESTKLYQQLLDDYFSTDDIHPGILKAWLLGRR